MSINREAMISIKPLKLTAAHEVASEDEVHPGPRPHFRMSYLLKKMSLPDGA
jgi:hypothetical protein